MRTFLTDIQCPQATLKEAVLGFPQIHLTVAVDPRGFILKDRARTVILKPCTPLVPYSPVTRRHIFFLGMGIQSYPASLNTMG